MWYGQKNYQDKMGNGPYTIGQIGCFVTSFCNLLQRFGVDVDPPSLNRHFTQNGIYLLDPADGAGVKDDLGWPSISAYDGQVHVIQIGGAGWPSDSNSIVKFAYNSPRTGAYTTHFCLVADPNAHTIVDSWDGIVRSPGYYGTPVAWATYANVVPEPVVVAVPTPEPVPQPVHPSTANSGDIITLRKGDTVAAIALRYNLDASAVLDHNGLSWDDARNLPVGYQLRLPISKAPAPATSGYKIEVLPEPKHMHVSKPGGAEKWGFGNIKDFSDFVSNGHVAENTNVDIVAVATVIIGSDALAYYMDALALGDYATSGHVANTIGINWKDLSDGSYEAPVAPVIEPTPPSPELPAHIVPAPPVEEPAENPNRYKSTWKPFDKSKMYIVDVGEGKSLDCPELDGRRPDHSLPNNTDVLIGGTVLKGQTLYGRPAGAIKAGYWFGCDMSKLKSHDEIYNTAVALADKKALKYALTYKEQLLVLLSSFVSIFTKVETALKRNKK